MGVKARVLAGTPEGIEGPIKTTSPTILSHVHLKPSASIALAVDGNAELGFFVLDGGLENETGAAIKPGALAVLGKCPDVALKTTRDQPRGECPPTGSG